MTEFEFKKGRALLLEKDAEHLHLHVGRGTTTFDLSLFVAALIVWVFDLLFLRDPLHFFLFILLLPLGYRGFRPLVQRDLEMDGDRYVLRRSLFGVGPRTSGSVASLHVDFERQGLYDGEERIAPVTDGIGRLIETWLDRDTATHHPG